MLSSQEIAQHPYTTSVPPDLTWPCRLLYTPTVYTLILLIVLPSNEMAASMLKAFCWYLLTIGCNVGALLQFVPERSSLLDILLLILLASGLILFRVVYDAIEPVPPEGYAARRRWIARWIDRRGGR